LKPELIDSTVDDPWADKTPPLGTVADSKADRARFCPLVMRYADGTQVHFLPSVKSTVFHGDRGTLTLSPQRLLDGTERIVASARRSAARDLVGTGTRGEAAS
jgi:hypothetical protein